MSPTSARDTLYTEERQGHRVEMSIKRVGQ